MVIHASTKGLFIVNIHENNHNNLTQACKIFFNQRDLQLGSPVFPQRNFSMSPSMINNDQNWSASLRDLQRAQPTWQSCLPQRDSSLQNGLPFQKGWYCNLHYRRCPIYQQSHQPFHMNYYNTTGLGSSMAEWSLQSLHFQSDFASPSFRCSLLLLPLKRKSINLILTKATFYLKGKA